MLRCSPSTKSKPIAQSVRRSLLFETHTLINTQTRATHHHHQKVIQNGTHGNTWVIPWSIFNCDIGIVAPCSAHSLAKLATGLCDDTLSCVLRAWDFGQYEYSSSSMVNTTTHDSTTLSIATIGKPLLIAPAMNTAMWEHPITAEHLHRVQSFGRRKRKHSTDTTPAAAATATASSNIDCGETRISNHHDDYTNHGVDTNRPRDSCVWVVPPQSKMLACGERGVGALADIDTIVQTVREMLSLYGTSPDGPKPTHIVDMHET
jgi:phosphopantothenoylcysteine synthetase/decarboxylase